jgi:hypothetical protein
MCFCVDSTLFIILCAGSAASLDQSMGDSGLGLTGHSRFAEGADSDIEVLSNPSQSSIEVLPTTDDNHRLEVFCKNI